ncbi:MAG: protein GlxC [Gammaproteobacteria bacterium]|nr:protein GlxC [Gammaproteobacteria bacterium]NIR83406.1 protein GlxC [Gammaproteobacteria bacterium]NIR91328.1 protein GlxC [Gammaproteobacteria bacterium]NIU04568.1 protein GlxC [Gammaproteobacteria bacterium]NIV51610.1 protein GlxC [Gammaproteobacteria bacterium]
MIEVDLDVVGVRDLNRQLHELPSDTNQLSWRVAHPRGKHALAVGLTLPLDVTVHGHVGYYCGGMNQRATLTINGNAGPGVAENMMSGLVRVKGNASQYAGASGRGGMLVIEGDASSRCGISMKGVDIVVRGSVGHMSAFMAQDGRLVVCGDAGAGLGDSIYEAIIYVGGDVDSLGADCIEKEMTTEHAEKLEGLLAKAGIEADVKRFRRFGSARKLYHFHVDHADSY